MARLGCHPAQGWTDATAKTGPPAGPVLEWCSQTPGDDAPLPRAPESRCGMAPSVLGCGIGHAPSLPLKQRGRAPDALLNFFRRWPPMEGPAAVAGEGALRPYARGAVRPSASHSFW